MDSSGVQIQLDPVAPPEAPKSRDVAPGRKRNDQGETRDAAAAAALTASFAEILQSKRLDLKAGAEAQAKEEPAVKTKKTGPKEGKEALLAVKGQHAAAKKKINLPALEVQARETLDHAKEQAGRAMKAAPVNPPGKENTDAAQPAELATKGALTPVEEALLKEMVQKQGHFAGQKKAAQMTGLVNGEPLNRREGIGTIKSMMAKEGEVLKNLSGGEEARAPQKTRAGKSAGNRQPSVPREASENEGKAAQATPFTETVRQELAGRAENAWEKLASAGEGKKQQGAGGANAEIRDVPAGTGALSAPPQGRGIDSPIPARPQAVVSQVLEGATQILRSGSGRLVVSLQPPQLGTLDLDVAVQDNRVKMVMLADNQEVKQMLQAGMDDLRNALQDKGFEIDRMEVLVQNRPDGAGPDFWQEAGFAREESAGRGRHRHEQESERAAHSPAVRPARAGDSGLSIFA
jgi:flagellar hook-length control protein FliK